MHLAISASIAILSLTASMAFASTPQPGYQAEFEVLTSGSTQKGYRKLEVLDNELSHEDLVVKSSEVSGDKTHVAQIEMSDADVSNADAVSDCPELGGSVETITVPAGTFTTCKTTRTEGDAKLEVWEAAVPFVEVKSVRTLADGKTETRQLMGYGVR